MKQLTTVKSKILVKTIRIQGQTPAKDIKADLTLHFKTEHYEKHNKPTSNTVETLIGNVLPTIKLEKRNAQYNRPMVL